MTLHSKVKFAWAVAGLVAALLAIGVHWVVGITGWRNEILPLVGITAFKTETPEDVEARKHAQREAARMRADEEAAQRRAETEAAQRRTEEEEIRKRMEAEAARKRGEAIAGVYVGNVLQKSISDGYSSRRIYRLVMNSDGTSGKLTIYIGSYLPAFEILVEGKMVDDRTFTGRTVPLQGETYYPDDIRLTFSPEAKRVTWYGRDNILKKEVLGTLVGTDSAAFAKRLSQVKAIHNAVTVCERDAVANRTTAYFLVVPVLGSANRVSTGTRAFYLKEQVLSGDASLHTGSYRLQILDFTGQVVTFHETRGVGIFFVSNGIYDEHGEPGTYTVGAVIDKNPIIWDSYSNKVWQPGMCNTIEVTYSTFEALFDVRK